MILHYDELFISASAILLHEILLGRRRVGDTVYASRDQDKHGYDKHMELQSSKITKGMKGTLSTFEIKFQKYFDRFNFFNRDTSF